MRTLARIRIRIHFTFIALDGFQNLIVSSFLLCLYCEARWEKTKKTTDYEIENHLK